MVDANFAMVDAMVDVMVDAMVVGPRQYIIRVFVIYQIMLG